MLKKNPKTLKIICAVTALITAVSITGCSCNGCNGIGSLFGLISGGGETTTTAAAETSTEPTAAATTTTTAASETTTAKETATTTKPSETTTTKPAETTTAHVHDWKYNGEDPATCTEDGKDWYICSKCGAEYYDVIPALGHDWQRTGGSAPACTADGKKVYTCMRCLDEYIELIPATGHNWSYVYHCDPSCEDYGYDTYQCLNCGAVENMDYDLYPPLGHDDYDIVGGAMGHTHCCSRCGHEFPETFSAHEWACLPDPSDPTLYHIYVCFMCGYVDHKAAHHMEDGSCTECGYSGPVG